MLENKPLEWNDHIVRMSSDKLVKSFEARQLKKKKGPRKTWLNRIEKIKEDRGKSLEKMKRLASNGNTWTNWFKNPDH